MKFPNNQNQRPNLEHIRPVKEIHNDTVMRTYTTHQERKDYANSKENTCLVREDINKSKNGTSISEQRNGLKKIRIDLI